MNLLLEQGLVYTKLVFVREHFNIFFSRKVPASVVSETCGKNLIRILLRNFIEK